MNPVARLFAFTLLLTLLGTTSACLTTLCLSALAGICGEQTSAAPPWIEPPARSPELAPEDCDHVDDVLRF